jgi:hypothetical protein
MNKRKGQKRNFTILTFFITSYSITLFKYRDVSIWTIFQTLKMKSNLSERNRFCESECVVYPF